MKTCIAVIGILLISFFVVRFFVMILTAKFPDMDDDGQEDSE